MRHGVVPLSLLATLIVSATLPACGEIRRLAGIEKSTKKTEETTGELNKNTKDMKDSVEQVDGNTVVMRKQLEDAKAQIVNANTRLDETNGKLADTNAKLDALTRSMDASKVNTDTLATNTGDTYVDLRQGDTLSARSRLLESLNSQGPQEAKIAEAFKYFAAFEFQFWTGRGPDTQERQAQLFTEAVDEFLHDVERWLPADAQRDVSPLSESGAMKNIYALATGLEALNSVQIDTQARVVGYTRVSLLDLLHRGLEAGIQMRAGRRGVDSLAAWERVVLEKENVVRFLLGVRQNFLPAVPLSSFTEIERGGLTRLGWLLRMGLTRWDAKLDAFGNTQIQSFSAWLQKSLMERDFLTKMFASGTPGGDARGAAAAYDGKLALAYRNMNVTDEASGAEVYRQERAKLRASFEEKARAIGLGG